jgi:septal ring factor EnvC (AmiA/AmiB activator)
MLGKIIHKNNEAEMAEYTKTAQWCNANNAMIEDKGEYYEVVAIPAPSTEEQLAQLDAQYNKDKADLLTAYQTAMLYGDTETMESLKADLNALDDQYDEDYERITGGE